MPRYKASIQIELTKKEQIKAKANAPEMFRFMGCSTEVITFEVKAINADEAFKKVTADVRAGKFNEKIKKRNYTISTIDEKHHRLAETLEDIQNDEDVSFLGYVCIGKMTDLYPSIPAEFHDDYYRTWIWENKENERIATWDRGNSWCTYMCQGKEEELLFYFNEMKRKNSN